MKHRRLPAALAVFAVAGTLVSALGPVPRGLAAPEPDDRPTTTVAAPSEDPAPTPTAPPADGSEPDDADGPGDGTLRPASRLESSDGTLLAPELVPTSSRASSIVAVVSEVMFDPDAVYDSRGEWFEIHNPGPTTLDLAGWTFGDEIYDLHRISDLRVAPGAYAVLARFGETGRNGGVTADYVYGDDVLLFNRGDRLVLRDRAGDIVDRVAFGDDGFPAQPGRSISLRDVSSDNASGANWCLSTTTMPAGDLGSPGRRNACGGSTASLVITEIMNNPQRSSDSTGEWFEIRNDGTAPIDLLGFTVQDDDGDSFTVGRTVVVPPAGHAVLGTSADRAVNGDVDIDYEYGAAMRLHNTFDELVLIDASGIQVDAVRWDDGRSFPDPDGASMNLISSGIDNSVGGNWCMSTRRWSRGDFGSPGADGSCEPTLLPSVVITEVMFDPEQTSSERNGEWFEVANVGDGPAVLDGFVLRTNSTEHVVGELTIPTGERAVLGSTGTSTQNGGLEVDYVYGTELPLYNTVSTLVVEAPDGTELDRVVWSASRGFPSEPGHSIELRSADADNTLGANWCIAFDRYGDGDFGTPGATGTCTTPPVPALVMISEVMINPAVVSDVAGEWFELYNPTGDDIDLFNWSISDEGSEFHLLRESVILPAGGRVVVARNGDPSTNGGVAADHVLGNAMSLVNTGDELVVSDQFGRVVDAVRWGGNTAMPRPNGAAIARTELSLDSLSSNEDASSWCTTTEQFGAGDRGTPRQVNDCTALPQHAVVINEIHRDPVATPDSIGEWIELHNTGDVAIDVGGWTLRDDDLDSFVIPAGSDSVIPAGGHLVAARTDASLNGGVDAAVVMGADFLLFNTVDEIVLLDHDLTLIDRVAWNAENGFPRVAGASMALREPALDNSVGANWCASVTDQGNGDLGTPGAANLCELPPEPEPDLPTTPTHSVFALGAPTCGVGIRIEASRIEIDGAVRSNGDIVLGGSSFDIDGRVSYGRAADLGWGTTTPGGSFLEPAPQTQTYGWRVADFAPGGRRAVAAGTNYHSHTGTWTVAASAIPAGVHHVDGDVVITGKSVKLNEITIVATGTIRIAGAAIDLRPWADDLPVLLSGADGCDRTGITINGSNIDIRGAVHAPTSQIAIQGSVVRSDPSALLGSSVRINGSRIELDAD